MCLAANGHDPRPEGDQGQRAEPSPGRRRRGWHPEHMLRDPVLTEEGSTFKTVSTALGRISELMMGGQESYMVVP